MSDMYLVETVVGKPILKTWKYALPGDKDIATIQRLVINVDTPKVVVFQIPADPHRATLSDDISSSGTWDDVYWSDDATQVAFVSTSRDHKNEKVRIADATTGAGPDVPQPSPAPAVAAPIPVRNAFFSVRGGRVCARRPSLL